MTHEEFGRLVEDRIGKINSVLASKGMEYASEKDRLSNFKIGAAITEWEPETVCLGYMLKHMTCVIEMVKDVEVGCLHSREKYDEKIGDLINYLILLEALFVERFSKKLRKVKDGQDTAATGEGTG